MVKRLKSENRRCPICLREPMPHDVKMVNRDFENVTIRGKVYAIIDTEKENNAWPWSSYYTVDFYPYKTRVKYIKFKTLEELQKWDFEIGQWYVVDGHMHQVLFGKSYKDVVFDIKNVSHVASE
jgi:hypothetical protein